MPSKNAFLKLLSLEMGDRVARVKELVFDEIFESKQMLREGNLIGNMTD